MNFEDAVRSIAAGRSMLFVGAGFSLDVLNQNNEGMPGGGQLAQLLMESMGSDERTDYGLAAQLYVQQHSDLALLDFLRPHLTTKEVLEEHAIISAAPWRRIYTTNFDDVIEFCLDRRNVKYASLTPSSEPPPTTPGTTSIVHLHGNVSRGAKERNAIELTKFSLSQPALQRTSWPTQIQVDIESSDSVFLVGYSLSDFHIANLLRSTSQTKRKTFIIVEEAPSAALMAYLGKFGTVMPIGLTALAAEISGAILSKTTTPAVPHLVCFERLTAPETYKTPTTEASVALLVAGLFDSAAYLANLRDGDGSPPYSFRRKRILAQAKPNTERPVTVVLQSRIGNGKSSCLHQIQYEALLDGAHIYIAKHPLPGIFAELDYIRGDPHQKVFIFDGHDGFDDVIKNVNQNLVAGDMLVLSTRLSDARSDSSPIRRILPGSYSIYDLNGMSDEEIIELERWISYYGLWGNLGGGSQPSRIRYVKEKCGREIRSVILALFQHGSLSQRITQATAKIENSGQDISIPFACLLLSRFADCPLDFFDVCELSDVEPYRTRELLKSVGSSEFLQVDTDDFDLRSSVLSEYILSKCLNGSYVFRALVSMIDSLTMLISADWRYEESLPNLMKFSIISKVFAEPEKRDLIIPFYEHLLRHNSIKTNPHFWLQFSMARLERDEFELAGKCLDNAYSEARARGSTYRTYMLDNQKVKFLLKSRTRQTNYTDHDKAFADSIELFRKQVDSMRTNIDIHVLRLIEPLVEFREQFRATISPNSCSKLSRIFEDLRHKIRFIGESEATTNEERRLTNLLSSS